MWLRNGRKELPLALQVSQLDGKVPSDTDRAGSVCPALALQGHAAQAHMAQSPEDSL